eukprot:CAMPEP_0168712146 /NCGR_PEP_ID=MMETSP0503-20121227/43512_1 /TAXON_ID=89963 /ORGANISM="Heterocapsa rotundata, Strain SCCAP K-0483" /LENGTH=40 /DNA_ID= /DNA_START= /DNA_END= /DNA_ORIENTATION=
MSRGGRQLNASEKMIKSPPPGEPRARGAVQEAHMYIMPDS